MCQIVFLKHGYDNPLPMWYSYNMALILLPRTWWDFCFSYSNVSRLLMMTGGHTRSPARLGHTRQYNFFLDLFETHSENPAVCREEAHISHGEKPDPAPKAQTGLLVNSQEQRATRESSAEWTLWSPLEPHLCVKQRWALPSQPCPNCRSVSKWGLLLFDAALFLGSLCSST